MVLENDDSRSKSKIKNSTHESTRKQIIDIKPNTPYIYGLSRNLHPML